LLLSKKADFQAQDKQGDTPLHVAVVENNFKVALLLVGAGADVEKENADGKNPLELSSPELREAIIPIARKLHPQQTHTFSDY
jgi:ankyrin repeat protein